MGSRPENGGDSLIHKKEIFIRALSKSPPEPGFQPNLRKKNDQIYLYTTVNNNNIWWYGIYNIFDTIMIFSL